MSGFQCKHNIDGSFYLDSQRAVGRTTPEQNAVHIILICTYYDRYSLYLLQPGALFCFAHGSRPQCISSN